jgi:hypothetical protein
VTAPIFVNGCEVQVTTNLHDALYELRKREEVAQSLWVDALCINQSNAVEKGHQVQRMGSIYSSANQVIAWLGLSDSTTARLVEIIHVAAQKAQALNIKRDREPDFPCMTGEQQSRLELATARTVLGSMLKKGDFGLVVTLFDKPYWSRLWTIQEFCLAKNPLLVCGMYTISFPDLEKTIGLTFWVRRCVQDADIYDAYLMDDHLVGNCRSLFHPLHPTAWLPPPAMWISSYLGASGNAFSSRYVLTTTINRTKLQASNPRDRVFALLGLLEEEARIAIRADYSQPCASVFKKATRYLLEQCGPSILEYSGLSYRSGSVNDLPSWAIDFADTRPRTEKLHLYVEPRYERSEHNWISSITAEGIVIQAARVDRIACVILYSGGLDDVQQVFSHLERHARTQGVVNPLLWAQLVSTLLYGQIFDIMLLHRDASILRLKLPGAVDGLDVVRHTNPERHITNRDIVLDEPTGYPQIDVQFPASLLHIDDPRVVFITEASYIGSGPPMTAVGDTIHAVRGSEFPYVLRPCITDSGQPGWKLVGSSYVQGITTLRARSENMQAFWDGNPPVEEILLC